MSDWLLLNYDRQVSSVTGIAEKSIIPGGAKIDLRRATADGSRVVLKG